MAYSYMGKTQTGTGQPLPFNPDGTLNINSLVGMLVDQRKDYIYDTKTIAPGFTFAGTPLRFFQVPIGGADPDNNNLIKTELETNMRSPGQFSAPYDFILNNLGFLVLVGADLFDISTVMNYTWFEFKVLQKQLFMGSMLRHPSGMGVTGYSTVTAQQSWINGLADPRAIWQFGDWRKYIPPLTQFTLNLYGNENYQNIFNATTTTSVNLPANIKAKLFDTSVLSATTSNPTLLPASLGGNGMRLVAIMNGISNGPVQ